MMTIKLLLSKISLWMISQALGVLKQSGRDISQSKLSWCKTSLHSLVLVFGKRYNHISAVLYWPRFLRVLLILKTMELLLPIFNSLNKLMRRDISKLCKNNFIKKPAQLRVWAAITTSTPIQGNSPRLQRLLNQERWDSNVIPQPAPHQQEH